MKNVFLETNWIVSHLAPAWFHDSTSAVLLAKHLKGEIQIHIPVVSIHEARKKLPSFSSNKLQEFDGLAGWALKEKPELAQDLKHIRERGHSELQAFEKDWPQRLLELCETLGGAIFPYRECAMDLQMELSKRPVQLEPFDQAILCSVVSETILLRLERAEGQTIFCTRDSHLHKPECISFASSYGVRMLRNFEV